MGDGQIIRKELSRLADRIKLKADFEKFFTDDFCVRKKYDSGCHPENNIISEKVKPLDVRENNKQGKVIPLSETVRDCTLCALHKTRTNVVFGAGSLDAELVFVGEAPGRDEDLQGKPFVGKAGELLTKIISAMKLSREQVYITNVLRCRPPNNRNPLPEEVVCCKPYLIQLLNIIKPRIICTLGKFAAHALLDVDTPISRLRGQFYEFNNIKLMPTYHPAYLLRNPDDKRLVWDDMQKIMKALQ